jgi:hypothetical protein
MEQHMRSMNGMILMGILFTTIPSESTSSRWDDYDNNNQDEAPAGAGVYNGHVYKFPDGGEYWHRVDDIDGPGAKGDGALYLKEGELDAEDARQLDLAVEQGDSDNTVVISSTGAVTASA